MLPFTLDFSRIDPDEFVRTVLVEKLHAYAVVVGEDFSFGHKARGDVRCSTSSARSTTTPWKGCRCWSWTG